ncbi:MAG TPA: glycine cleavage T C-terminal barrel domain-containing protein [Pirellulales bacterium]|nr:glycine cleavage T C-terminal barrel domain-containing protein [Pirellulales bacterium]
MSTVDSELLADYDALTAGAALVDFNRRTLVELTGDDRARFLHNLSTNEIVKLPVHAGCEAFLTNVQGKILAHVLVFAEPDALVLDTVPGQGPAIVKHLDRYLIRERVTLADRTADWAEWLLTGSRSAQILASLCGDAVPADPWTSSPAQIAGHLVTLRRVDLVGPVGFLILSDRSAAVAIRDALTAGGAKLVGAAAFEAVRIEAGFPLYGQDVSERNLPQEVARDARTISFRKGCYLGQETVARIDALGHVNQLLVGLRFAGRPDATPGLELLAGTAKAGHVTSAAFSPRQQATVALGYVRRGSHAPGTKLDSSLGTAEVIPLPAGVQPQH